MTAYGSGICGMQREKPGFAGHKRRTDLDDDRMLVFALVKAIEIVGEASNQVSEATHRELHGG